MSDKQEPAGGGMEERIGRLLELGVAASLVLVVAGTLLTFVHHPDYVRVEQKPGWINRLPMQPSETLDDVSIGLHRFEGRALVSLGLLLLMSIPVLRVAASLLEFLHQRDWSYVMLTAFVLVMLVLSFLSGKAAG